MRQNHTRSSSGNVFFLVLVGIALFAALSYAITSSSRGSADANSTGEKQAAQAAAFLQNITSLQVALHRVKVSGSCPTLNATSPTSNQLFGNPATYPGVCNIYDKVKGGGAVYNLFPSSSKIYGTYPPTGEGKRLTFLNSMMVRGFGTFNAPEIITIVFNISPGLCNAINKASKVETSNGLPPLEDTPYEGIWNSSTSYCCNDSYDNMTIGRANGADNALVGKPTGCFRAPRAGVMGYHFYNVMEAH